MKLHVHDKVQWCVGPDEVDWLGPDRDIAAAISLKLQFTVSIHSKFITNSAGYVFSSTMPCGCLNNHRDFLHRSLLLSLRPMGCHLEAERQLYRPLPLALKCEK